MGCRRPSPAPLLLLLLLLSGHASAAMNVQALQKQVKRHMKRAHSLMDKDFDGAPVLTLLSFSLFLSLSLSFSLFSPYLSPAPHSCTILQ